MPNTITLTGLVGNAIGAMFLARGNFLVGGLLVLLMGPIDALDGAMARLRGEASDFGAFVATQQTALIVLTFFAAAGSVLVSYVKARAESLAFEAKGGLLTRFERYLILAPALVLTGFGATQAVWIGIALIAVLANVTALQRIRAVQQQARRRSG